MAGRVEAWACPYADTVEDTIVAENEVEDMVVDRVGSIEADEDGRNSYHAAVAV